MKDYKLEIWATLICFIIVAFIGGFFSSFVVILMKLFLTRFQHLKGWLTFTERPCSLLRSTLQCWAFLYTIFCLLCSAG